MVSSTRRLLPVIYFTVLLVILQVNLSNACGGLREEDWGFISSPNHNRPKNAHCVWDIVAPKKSIFTFSFITFYVGPNTTDGGCIDSVEVHAKISLEEDWKSMEKFCGSSLPPNVTFEGRQMRIEFRSNNSVTSSWFSAKYSFMEVCGGVLDQEMGRFQSPNYLHSYPPNAHCIWDIVAPRKVLFTLRFSLMRIIISPSCSADYVEVNTKVSLEEDWKSIKKFCGFDPPPTFTFEGRQMRIIFGSDGIGGHDGFSAHYSITDSCGGVLDGDRGTITSPNHPSNYSNNAHCIWDIVAPRKVLFTLSFAHFEIESWSGNCHDSLKVHTKNSLEENWKLMRTLCGFSLPPNVTLEGRQMRIEFRSDHSNVNSGFSAEYSFIDIATPTTVPPTTVTSSSRHYTSTLYDIATPTTVPPTIVTSSPREIVNDEVSLAKKKLVDWFMSLRRKGTQSKKWGHQLPRIAVAIFLADQENFRSWNRAMDEMNYELTIQLLSKLQGGGHLKRQDLSLYIPALMVACVDPRNFHGRDLVAELRSDIESNNGTGSPFELLVLCNAGDAMSDRDVQRMTTSFDSQHRPFWTDNQAMATLALACASAQPNVTVDERTLLDMAQELKKRQFRNGTVDNIKTTALVIQALAATENQERDFDFLAAVRSLLAAQREDGSVGSFLDSYYVLPVLSRSTLLNVTVNQCKKPETSESETLNELQGSRGSRVSITYSVLIGTDVDLKRTWTLKVPANSSLYSIMETVQKLDSRQQVEYNVIDGKPFVSSVMGIQDDVETGFYWFTFLRKHNAEDSMLVEDSPVDVKIAANQELILWYKSGQWNNK